METTNTVFRSSLSAMLNQRRQIEVAAENLANARTTRTDSGGPYRPKEIQYNSSDVTAFRQMLAQSVGGNGSQQALSDLVGNAPNLAPRIQVIETDRVRHEYNPNHPDADIHGIVAFPDIDTAEEMHRMVNAMRLYEANLNAIEAEKEILKRSFELGQA